MKSTIAFLAVALRLVSAQGSTMTTVVGGGATGAAPSSTPSGSSDAGVVGPADAICGQGFTYCGSMLVEHQGYQSSDVVKAYCSASENNCVGGKTRTDPMQGLFVCRPNTASPKRSLGMARNSNNQLGSGHRGSHVLAGGAVDGAAAAAAATPSDQCAPGSSPTKGNRIQLLCACSNACLNPASDHIARCDASCS